MVSREHPQLPGRRILIVEDEAVVAMDVEDTLAEQGCQIVGCARTIESALKAVDELGPEAAILDLNLDGQPTLPVAERMRSQGIPFVIVSGYGELVSSHPLLASAPVVQKPWNQELLLARLEGVLKV